MKNDVQSTVAVVGAGPAGLAAALALARSGLQITLIGAPPTGGDNRTAALFTGSMLLLRNLGAFESDASIGERLTGIRIIDDMGALLRAPEVTFRAREVGLESFGANITNLALVAALSRQVAATTNIETIETANVVGLDIAPEGVTVRLSDGAERSFALVVGADGRNSVCRAAAGIVPRTWAYEQSALTCTFSHQRPHHGISTEFHRPNGPFTVVPSPGNTSSLVWVERPAVARRMADLDEDAFRATLETRLQGLLGPIGEIGPRGLFPLSGLSADPAGLNRVALVGEAAHVFPPIGAQGLNLGLRDVAILSDCVADAVASGADIGSPQVLESYAKGRRSDIASRAWSIDLLNKTLISGFLPVQLLRGAGLFALKTIKPLRRLAISEGLGPSFVTPSLMRQVAASPTSAS